MNTISYSAVRAQLSSTMDKVIHDHEAVIITRSNRPAVVMLSLEDYQAMEETAYLLRSPVNAQRLLTSITQLEAGHGVRKTWDELEAAVS